tara:strand:+ start:9 stop:857 length:849 start_codon:yes stop_codon:yes gene_type:complete
MYTEKFDYIKASTIEEAISLKLEDEDSSILAGGHSLIPAMKLRLSTPSKLIDISEIEQLKNISKAGDHIIIGALCTHKQCSESNLIQDNCPALSDAASVIGDPHVRNKGTIGGALAHSDPQADYPGAILALNGTIIVMGSSGKREIAIGNYFTGLWETALKNGEILTEIKIPISAMNANSCYLKFPQPASRYPYVGCAIAMSISNTNCSDIRIGFSGVGEFAFRDKVVEDSIRGESLNKTSIENASSKATEGRNVLNDSFVSEEYRRAMAKVFVKRALTKVS